MLKILIKILFCSFRYSYLSDLNEKYIFYHHPMFIIFLFFSLIDGKAGQIISEEAANVILIVDSVVIFTICQLSKVRKNLVLFQSFSQAI